jgi:hypothetical protein
MVSPFLFKQSVEADGHLCYKYNAEILPISKGVLKILVKLLDINDFSSHVVFAPVLHMVAFPQRAKMFYFTTQDMVFTYNLIM